MYSSLNFDKNFYTKHIIFEMSFLKTDSLKYINYANIYHKLVSMYVWNYYSRI